MRKSKGGMFQKLRKSIPAIKTLLETIRVFSATCTNFQERLLRPRCSVQIINLYVYVWLILTSSSRVWFCKTQKEPWVIGPSLVASSSPLKICFLVEDRAKETASRIRKKTDSRWPIQLFSLLHESLLTPSSLRGKRFQSSYCAIVSFFCSSQLCRRTRAETLPTQARLLVNLKLACFSF